MSNVTFNPSVLSAEEALRSGLSIGAGGVVSFSPESVSSAMSLFADSEAWKNVEAGTEAIIAASGKILVDEAKGYLPANPEVQALSLTLSLNNDSVDHRFNRNNELTSSYTVRGATEHAEELNNVHQYAAALFKDTE